MSDLLTSKPQADDREREDQAVYATQYADPHFLALERCGHAAWGCHNALFYGGALKRPHLGFGPVPPRSCACFSPTTKYGAPDDFTISERLTTEPDPDWIVNPFPAAGVRLFIEDSVLKLIVQQACHQLPSARTRGLTAECNRVGLHLGLAPVLDRRRGRTDDGRPVLAGWPFNVRPEDHYGDDITEVLRLFVTGTTRPRPNRLTPHPQLGVWEYILLLLSNGRTEDLRRLAATQVDRLHALRHRRLPVLARFERGQEDEDGSPITGPVAFDPIWLTWNGGTVLTVAQGIHAFREYPSLPILADALEEAGCEDGRILRHLRSATKGHDSRCWVLRNLLATRADLSSASDTHDVSQQESK